MSFRSNKLTLKTVGSAESSPIHATSAQHTATNVTAATEKTIGPSRVQPENLDSPENTGLKTDIRRKRDTIRVDIRKRNRIDIQKESTTKSDMKRKDGQIPGERKNRKEIVANMKKEIKIEGNVTEEKSQKKPNRKTQEHREKDAKDDRQVKDDL